MKRRFFSYRYKEKIFLCEDKKEIFLIEKMMENHCHSRNENDWRWRLIYPARTKTIIDISYKNEDKD